MKQPTGELHRAARWYIQHDIPVFPLQPRDKRPLSAHGFKDASTDPVQIEDWWTQHPTANLGMPTGSASHRLLVDCDFRGQCRARSRDDVRELYGEWDSTCEVVTGSGSLHVYFTGPLGPVPKQIDAGIELKSDGGYSVLPPSIHPCGRPYTFDGVRGRETFLRLAQPPAWLVQKIADAGAKHTPPDDGDAAAWPEGQRNNQLASLAGKLRRNGLSPAALEAALLEENRRRCDPPLSDVEVHAVARSISRYLPADEQPRHSAPRTATINLDSFQPSLELLNGLTVFQGRVRFQSAKKLGAMLLAVTDEGREIVWQNMSDLAKFTTSQAAIAEATGILLPTPPQGQIRTQWEAAVHLLLQLSMADGIVLGNALKEDIRTQLNLMWRSSGQPVAPSSREFIDFVRTAKGSRRDPGGMIPPTVFIAEDFVWVHAPSFIRWLSIPAMTNKHYPLTDVRNGLLLLGFVNLENLTRGFETDSETVCLWRGPLEVLED